MSAQDRPIVNPIYGVFTTAGVIPAATQKTGTITSSGTVVTGVGTSFKSLSQVRKGDYVYAQDQVRIVTGIFSDTRLDINRAFAPDIAIGVDFYVIRNVPNVAVSIANNGGGVVDINTVGADAQDLQEGDVSNYTSLNGIGPIAYVPNGATIEISNGVITKSGTATVTGTVDTEIVGPLGQEPMADSVSVVIASDQTAVPVTGNVGGFTATSASTIAFSTGGAAATGDYVGTTTTPQSFASVVRTSGGTAILQSLTIVDKLTTAAVDLELWLYSATFTAPTDNAAWTITDTDALKLVGVIKITGSDWVASAANKSYTQTGIGLPIKPAATSLFYALVARGTTPAWNTGDIQMTLGLLQD